MKPSVKRKRAQIHLIFGGVFLGLAFVQPFDVGSLVTAGIGVLWVAGAWFTLSRIT